MNRQIMRSWSTLAGRINAMSLRERVLLFLSVIVCLIVFADTFWLSPAQVAHKLLVQRYDRQRHELNDTRQALSRLAKPVDAGKVVRDQITATELRLAEVNRNIQQVAPTQANTPPLVQVLTHLLRRHEGLTLVRTATVAPSTAVVADADAAVAGWTRQGVELTVSGPYAELTRYLQTLERALPYVRWGTMTLKSDKAPVELTLQLFLVGVKP